MKRSAAGSFMCVAVMVILVCFASSASPKTAPSPAPRQEGSLGLLEAVERALRTHPSVGVAQAGEEESVARVGEARAELYPKLSGNASLTQYQKPSLVAPFHSLDFSRLPDFDTTLIRGTLRVGYDLFDGGARSARFRSAQAQAAGVRAERAEAEVLLTAAVTRAYLEVLSAKGVLDAQDRRLDALRAERRRVEQFLAEGRAARVELLRVEASLAQAEAERISTSLRLEVGERALARLIDVPAEQARAERLREVHLKEDHPQADWKTLLEKARKTSPELERARKTAEAAEEEKSAARAVWAPRIGLQGEYLSFGATGSEWSAEWLAGLQLNYPIYTGGARAHAVASAAARARRAREQLRLRELELEDGVDQALSAALQAHALVEALRKAVQHESEVVRIEKLSLDVGAGTQTDYLRAEAELLRGRSSLVEARHGEIARWVELARVVGELDRRWLETHLEIVP